MEKIIIYIVIMVVVFLFEQIKKMSKKAASTPARKPGPRRQARNDSTSPRPARPAPPRPAPAGASALAAASVATSHYKPLEISYIEETAEEGGSALTVDTPIDNEGNGDSPSAQTSAPAAAEDAARAAHYARWRQAILDTQVLERKF